MFGQNKSLCSEEAVFYLHALLQLAVVSNMLLIKSLFLSTLYSLYICFHLFMYGCKG